MWTYRHREDCDNTVLQLPRDWMTTRTREAMHQIDQCVGRHRSLLYEASSLGSLLPFEF